MTEAREVLTWAVFGDASRELATQLARSRYRPLRCAVLYEKPRSTVKPEYDWRQGRSLDRVPMVKPGIGPEGIGNNLVSG